MWSPFLSSGQNISQFISIQSTNSRNSIQCITKWFVYVVMWVFSIDCLWKVGRVTDVRISDIWSHCEKKFPLYSRNHIFQWSDKREIWTEVNNSPTLTIKLFYEWCQLESWCCYTTLKEKNLRPLYRAVWLLNCSVMKDDNPVVLGSDTYPMC